VQYLADLFNAADLTPHGVCLLWRPELIWLHVFSDLVIGLAYYSIPLALAYFVSKRADIVFGWIFWLFAIFILACGTTHWFEIWTLWRPDYAAQGLLKFATAGVSLVTAFLLWPLVPQALALPSPAQLRRVNDELSVQVRERNDAVEALQREILERQRAEDALRQSQKLEALGQLTGGVAHDFNNLMFVITGNLHLLKGKVTAGGEAQMKAIEQAVARGESLTRQLLTFARRQTLQPTVVELREHMRRVVELLRRSLRGDIEIRLDVAPGTWPVEIDPNEFELAMINIALNARDAMPAGGTLTLTIDNESLAVGNAALPELAGDFVRIAIGDSGHGIAAAMLSRVFEPFFTTKEVGKGTGLGLSQVYGFAKQSGGLATIASVEGKGTTITLYLPRTSRAASTEAAAAGQEAARGKGTILLVEDNQEVADVSAALLAEHGYAVRRAGTAQQALDLLVTGEPIDLVFSDIVMPGEMSGVELARRLRERFPGVAVLLTTGYSAAAQDATNEGFAILPKPYRPDALHRAIRTKLGPQAAGATA
jgi:signal transduction histidine kinase/CheY-like chemotaxis protein